MSIKFHDGSGHVFSMDKKVIKIWDVLNGDALTSIKSKKELKDFDFFSRSGLILSGSEQPKMQVHYLPSLGPAAPKWCVFLDNITEELEESSETPTDIYENY